MKSAINCFPLTTFSKKDTVYFFNSFALPKYLNHFSDEDMLFIQTRYYKIAQNECVPQYIVLLNLAIYNLQVLA